MAASFSRNVMPNTLPPSHPRRKGAPWRLAAVRDTLRAGANFDRRDGELKMDWTKPGGLAGQLPYGH